MNAKFYSSKNLFTSSELLYKRKSTPIPFHIHHFKKGTKLPNQATLYLHSSSKPVLQNVLQSFDSLRLNQAKLVTDSLVRELR